MSHALAGMADVNGQAGSPAGTLVSGHKAAAEHPTEASEGTIEGVERAGTCQENGRAAESLRSQNEQQQQQRHGLPEGKHHNGSSMEGRSRHRSRTRSHSRGRSTSPKGRRGSSRHRSRSHSGSARARHNNSSTHHHRRHHSRSRERHQHGSRGRAEERKRHRSRSKSRSRSEGRQQRRHGSKHRGGSRGSRSRSDDCRPARHGSRSRSRSAHRHHHKRKQHHHHKRSRSPRSKSRTQSKSGGRQRSRSRSGSRRRHGRHKRSRSSSRSRSRSGSRERGREQHAKHRQQQQQRQHEQERLAVQGHPPSEGVPAQQQGQQQQPQLQVQEPMLRSASGGQVVKLRIKPGSPAVGTAAELAALASPAAVATAAALEALQMQAPKLKLASAVGAGAGGGAARGGAGLQRPPAPQQQQQQQQQHRLSFGDELEEAEAELGTPRERRGLAAATASRFKHEKTLVLLNPLHPGPSSHPLEDDEESLPPSPVAAGKELAPVVWAAATAKGMRPYMEDRHTIVADFLPKTASGHSIQDGVPRAYAAVFDGHNGASAAELAAEKLHHLVSSHPAVRTSTGDGPPTMVLQEEERVADALVHAFESLDREILLKSRLEGIKGGATALVVLRIGSQLFAAHAGDTRAVLSRHGSALRLTEDHKPNLPRERKRVEAAGGRVDFARCWRVIVEPGGGRPASGLAVSRSLGDPDFKEPLHLVSATPDVMRERLLPGDEFVILASDGLWDVLSDADACAIVSEQLDHAKTAGKLSGPHGIHKRLPASNGQRHLIANAAAEALVEAALAKGTMDNVTAVVGLLIWD